MISRFGVENTNVILAAASFIVNHPLECWDTQNEITAQMNFQKKNKSTLKNLIIANFMSNLENKRIDIYLIQFVFKCFYFIFNKTLI
jgi:hypothetical protein